MGFDQGLKSYREEGTFGRWLTREGSPPEGEKIVAIGGGTLEPGGCFTFVGFHGIS